MDRPWEGYPASWCSDPLSLIVDRTYDLILTSRIWQRWWDIISLITSQKIVTSVLLAGCDCGLIPLVALIKNAAVWIDPHGQEIRDVPGNKGLYLAAYKDLNPVNNYMNLEANLCAVNPQMKTQHWPMPWLQPCEKQWSRRPSETILEYLIWRNSEIINVCGLRLLKLRKFVIHQQLMSYTLSVVNN